MKVFIVFDDTGKKSEMVADIIGNKGFSDVVVKKQRLEERYRLELEKVYGTLVFRRLRSFFEYPELIKELELYEASDMRVVHCFSNYLIADPQKALLSFKKLEYIDEPYGMLCEGRSVAALFADVPSYIRFCKNAMSGQKAWDMARAMSANFEAEGLIDIGNIQNFIQCITGDFDSRYFNSLKEDEYTVTKTSSDKKKLKAEYDFYHLLPDDMKFWFVMPFDYKENGECASYTMERLHMTDLAIKWVHGSMDEAEFCALMDKYFYFFSCRHSKECKKKEAEKVAAALYEDKVRDRFEQLQKHPDFKAVEALLNASKNIDLNGLFERYFELKDRIEVQVQKKQQLVIGHGDPCFANALYNRSANILKFIDPKGANSEKELWTDAYYDVAKLSHSVCGRYDFFNNGMFDIKIDTDLSYVLEIPFDNSMYKEVFLKKAAENGFDPLLVRVYEASLFLSMLPLHMDNPHKVLGFILNAAGILDEIDRGGV